MILRILLLLVTILPIAAWCDDLANFAPAQRPDGTMSGVLNGGAALPDGLRYPLFGGGMVLSLDPFSGTGPYHFENLSSSPYYARDKDVAVGLRLGVVLPLTSSLMLELQLPVTVNPSPEYQDPLAYYGPLNANRHLDASIGLLWSF